MAQHQGPPLLGVGQLRLARACGQAMRQRPSSVNKRTRTEEVSAVCSVNAPPTKLSRLSGHGPASSTSSEHAPHWESLPKDVLGIIASVLLDSQGAAGSMRLACRAWRSAVAFEEVEQLRCNLRQQPFWPLPEPISKHVKHLILRFPCREHRVHQQRQPQLQEFTAVEAAELQERLAAADLKRLGQALPGTSTRTTTRRLLLQLPGFTVNARDLATALSAVPCLQQDWPQLHIEAGELRLMGTTGLEPWLVSACNVVDIMLRTPWMVKNLHLKATWPRYLLPRAVHDLVALESLSVLLALDLASPSWDPTLPGPLRARGGLLAFLGELSSRLRLLELRLPAWAQADTPCSLPDLVLRACQGLLLPCSLQCPSLERLVCSIDCCCSWPASDPRPPRCNASTAALLMDKWSVRVEAGNVRAVALAAPSSSNVRQVSVRLIFEAHKPSP